MSQPDQSLQSHGQQQTQGWLESPRPCCLYIASGMSAVLGNRPKPLCISSDANLLPLVPTDCAMLAGLGDEAITKYLRALAALPKHLG